MLCVLLLGLTTVVPAQSPTEKSVELRIIVVDSSSQAENVLQRLKNGEDFAAIAKEISMDPTSSDGGYMGLLDRSSLRQELRDALHGVDPGQITGVIRLPSGYALLKVLLPSETAALQNTSPARILPSAATGTIRYAPNVGGKGEADLAFRNLSKPEDWSMDLHGLCQIRQQSLAAVTDHILKSLDPTNPEGVAHGRPPGHHSNALRSGQCVRVSGRNG
jgi:hypothetical protein